MARPTDSEATTARVNVRFRNRRNGISGSETLRSTTTNSAAASRDPPTIQALVAETHSKSWPARVTQSSRRVVAVAIRAMPRMSMFAFRGERRSSLRFFSTITRAARANGTETKKFHLHPRVSVIRPPSSGPPTVATAMTAPNSPM